MWTTIFDIVVCCYSRGDLLGKLHTEERKVAEEVWEPPVEIENSEATTEADAETSTESAYWFIPQSSDCLISDEEKEQLPLFIGKVSCRLII